MSSMAKRVGLGLVAAASLAGIGLLAAPAQADKRMLCDMKGTWIEQRDDFSFTANYIAKDGPDTFDGIYTNVSAGAVATIKGVASNGTWAIVLTYTDAKHRGQTRNLIGQGKMIGTLLEVKGTYGYKQDGREIGKGNFTLIGKCK